MSLWEPDILNGVGEKRRDTRGVRRMLRAMLDDALRSALDGHHRERERQEAREWLLDDDATHLYSFRNVCQELELDPNMIRRRLLAKTEPASPKHR